MQDPFLNTRRPILAVIGVMGLMTMAPAVSQGGVVFYTNQPAFNAAEPGLPVQSFDSANLFSQPYVYETNGLNSVTANAVFASGTILPGLTISTLSPGLQSTALIVYGGGPVGAISVGNNWFGDTLVLSFAPGVSAMAEDLFANTAASTSFAGNNTEEVFNGTTSLGSITVSNAAGGYDFIGVISTNLPITSVQFTWDEDGDAITFVSHIAFGAIVPNPILVPNGANSLKILWPATGNYTLLQNANLARGSWVTNSSPITTSNGTNSITITPSSSNLFFRLRYP